MPKLVIGLYPPGFGSAYRFPRSFVPTQGFRFFARAINPASDRPVLSLFSAAMMAAILAEMTADLLVKGTRHQLMNLSPIAQA